MSNIGEEQREIIVEPLEIPVPVRESPAQTPQAAPQPVETPHEVRVPVPVR